MDNVTHTLAGLVVGHAALYLRGHYFRRPALPAQQAPAAPSGVQIATLTVSALANNAPDLDFLYRGITPGKLGYLLHHRGHTHTLLAALPLAVVCVACTLGLLRLVPLALRARSGGQRISRSDAGFLFAVATLGGLLHVLMDFGNNYGVHPFWPLDDRWFYGDAIFIVEPWFMITLAGIAFGATERARSRVLLGLLLAGLLLIAWRQALRPGGFLGYGLALLLSAGAVLWLAWMRAAPPRWRRISGLLALGLGLSAQLVARQRARAHVAAALARDASVAQVSLVATPLPANPLCWSLLAVGVQGEQYVVQQATASAWPAVWAPTACPEPSADTTAPLAAASPARPAASGVVWGREFRAPLGALRALVRDDCVARGFARFARVPFWLPGPGAQLIGDLRYDRSADEEFAELWLRPGTGRCPSFEPPWRPPLPLLDPLVP